MYGYENGEGACNIKSSAGQAPLSKSPALSWLLGEGQGVRLNRHPFARGRPGAVKL